LESTDLSVDDIAGRVGFAGGSSLREHLQAILRAQGCVSDALLRHH